jgi:hypothetical protein
MPIVSVHQCTSQGQNGTQRTLPVHWKRVSYYEWCVGVFICKNKRRGQGSGGVMAQTMYAHMNKCTKNYNL